MKSSTKLLSVLLGLSIITADAEARGDGKKSGGGGRASSSSSSKREGGSSSSAKRSPMTGSKMERPSAKPVPKPATRPSNKDGSKSASRPESRPAPKPAQRPSVERPTTRPDTRPDNKPDGGRPDNKLPDKRPGDGGANRPDNKLPDKRPGGGGADSPNNKLPDKRPGGGGANRPDNKPPDNRPGGGGADRPDKLPDKRPGDGANRPDNRLPDKLPDNRPGGGGGGTNRPDNKLPNKFPDKRPGGGGDNRPNINRPGNNRPSTLPGMVTYPNRPGNNNNNRPGNNSRPDRVNVNKVNVNSGNTYVKNVNKDRKNTYLNRPANFNTTNRDWDNNRWGGNRGVWGNNNNVNVHIDNNFRNSNNYSYRPNYWGARPWWGASESHGWHHGHWNYGYNSHYYGNRYYYNDNNFASGFMWGIAVWSLGNMVYDMGYQSYRNPYPAPPVQAYSSKTTINYTQPVSVTAAANPPGDEAATTLAETKSADATESSRAAFKTGDYVTALKSVDEAIAYTPGDVTLHEYRSLVLFALGRYSDAAGVLNPVLASGPGWGWDTMIGFYDSSSTYTTQLRKLEAYVKGKPDAADGHFLLGYHYLVSNYMDKACEQFDKAVKLQPADSISRQLRDLTKSSLPDAGATEEEPAAEAPVPPPSIPSEKLVGTWVSAAGNGGKITFKMEQDGNFVWSFVEGEKSSELKGTYGLDDKGLLVLTTDDTQMVSSVSLAKDSELKFVLVGSPDGDPGLDFKKG